VTLGFRTSATDQSPSNNSNVEVPSSWSFNATNILAQKVLPRDPRTEERETSLKQVADRIVDTITAWGVERDYFVDDEEAEAFRAELKHL